MCSPDHFIYKATGELHILVFTEPYEFVTIGNRSSWLGAPDDFEKHFRPALHNEIQ